MGYINHANNGNAPDLYITPTSSCSGFGMINSGTTLVTYDGTAWSTIEFAPGGSTPGTFWFDSSTFDLSGDSGDNLRLKDDSGTPGNSVFDMSGCTVKFYANVLLGLTSYSKIDVLYCTEGGTGSGVDNDFSFTLTGGTASSVNRSVCHN